VTGRVRALPRFGRRDQVKASLGHPYAGCTSPPSQRSSRRSVPAVPRPRHPQAYGSDPGPCRPVLARAAGARPEVGRVPPGHGHQLREDARRVHDRHGHDDDPRDADVDRVLAHVRHAQAHPCVFLLPSRPHPMTDPPARSAAEKKIIWAIPAVFPTAASATPTPAAGDDDCTLSITYGGTTTRSITKFATATATSTKHRTVTVPVHLDMPPLPERLRPKKV
jgi:hypothetical protein